jgi:predicted RNase H-like HicB family nuclease
MMNKGPREYEMELYQLDCILHEPCEDQGWLFMAEIPALPGCRAWGETANKTLAELSTVAEQFLLSYKDRGKPLPEDIARSRTGQGSISVAV